MAAGVTGTKPESTPRSPPFHAVDGGFPVYGEGEKVSNGLGVEKEVV